jgi:hypothetical protein
MLLRQMQAKIKLLATPCHKIFHSPANSEHKVIGKRNPKFQLTNNPNNSKNQQTQRRRV